MAAMTDPQYYVCAICGVMKVGSAPHGEGSPCPQKVKVDEAYVEMLDAQRMAHVRAGGSYEDIARALAKIAGV